MNQNHTSYATTSYRQPNSVTHFPQVIGFSLYHSYVIMNVTNQNQSLVKSELRHYFIRLTICYPLMHVGDHNRLNQISNQNTNAIPGRKKEE